jgi:hypothetical protein
MKKIVFTLILVIGCMVAQTTSAAVMKWVSTGTATDVLGNETDALSLHQDILNKKGLFTYTYKFTVTPGAETNGTFTRLTTGKDAANLVFTKLLLDGISMEKVQDSFNTYWEASVSSAILHTFSISGKTLNAKAGRSFNLTATATPIPAAIWLFGSGLVGLVSILRRKN